MYQTRRGSQPTSCSGTGRPWVSIPLTATTLPAPAATAQPSAPMAGLTVRPSARRAVKRAIDGPERRIVATDRSVPGGPITATG